MKTWLLKNVYANIVRAAVVFKIFCLRLKSVCEKIYFYYYTIFFFIKLHRESFGIIYFFKFKLQKNGFVKKN